MKILCKHRKYDFQDNCDCGVKVSRVGRCRLFINIFISQLNIVNMDLVKIKLKREKTVIYKNNELFSDIYA